MSLISHARSTIGFTDPVVEAREVLSGVVDHAGRRRSIGRSTFSVLHTPVTSAPNALAICTAKVPTPPEAPSTRTRRPAALARDPSPTAGS
jgi:hypothetical protein